MSLSSYIQRRSRVSRKSSVASSVRLTSILEEPVCLPETSAAEAALKKAKKNSMKARRRLGVSNLSPLLNDSEWSLRLPECLGEDSKDQSFDFPRPPIPVFESDAEASSSDESSGSELSSEESPMPTTPTQSPSSAACDFVAVAAELQQGARVLRRCKTIKPLVIAKRAVSPIPPVSSEKDEEDSDSDNDAAWQDDDEYYASHASGFITLAPPLPASFPSPSVPALPIRSSTSAASTSTPATRRESAIIAPACEQLDAPKPHRASVRLSRAFTIPARAPPPPPIVTASASSSRPAAAPRTPSPTASPRPPPRTPVPTDADDFATDPTRLSLFASTSNASTSLAALLSPPPQFAFGFPPAGVPSDVDDGDEGVWEEVALEEMEVEVELACADEDEREDAFDEVPLSPFVAAAAAPASTPETPLHSRWSASTSALSPPPHTPASASALRSRWSASTSAPTTPGSALRSRWSASTAAFSPRAHEDAAEPMAPIPESPAPPRSRWSASTAASPAPHTPALRSRWSSSTLSSIHSAHAAAASPKTFSFRGARRYFPLPSPKKRASHKSASSSKSAAPAFDSASMAPYANPRGPPRKKQRKLTVADVQVHLPVVGAPPATPSVLACASPDVFSTSFSGAPPMTPATPGGQWAAYPASPPPPPALRPIGGASEALYAAYTTQRSPRRRVSNASSASGWSSPSRGASSGSSGSGCSDSGYAPSECGSAGSGASAGLRRKPIPVAMFLR